MKLKTPKKTTIGAFLAQKLQGISNNKIKQMLKFSKITANGVVLSRLEDVLEENAEVVISSESGGKNAASASSAKFKILFEDQYLIAGVKPAGILTSGKNNDRHPSFFEEMRSYLRKKPKESGELFVIHRLDREVTGIVLFAKSEAIQQLVKDSWKDNTKLYHAYVEGKVRQEKGRIESFLAEDPHTLKMYSTDQLETQDCKHAVTHYRVAQRIGHHTLLEIELETGRKNQIRVHLAEMGHPIIGDRRYGADDKFERQIRLCAFYLKVLHPVTKQWLELKNPMPNNFLHLPAKDERYK